MGRKTGVREKQEEANLGSASYEDDEGDRRPITTRSWGRRPDLGGGDQILEAATRWRGERGE
jgi:hypothetical protein